MAREIRNPQAYQAAIDARMKANRWNTQRAKLVDAIREESDDFRAWLLSAATPALNALRVQAQAEFDADPDGEHGPADTAYRAALQAWSRRVGPLPQFLRDALDQWGGLTDKQLAVARQRFAENIARAEGREAAERERRASATPWTAGRQEVTGVIQSARYESVEIGYSRTAASLKAMLQTADGRKLWTSLPRRLWPTDTNETAGLRGQTVSFTVTVEPKADEPTMAFGSRPR